MVPISRGNTKIVERVKTISRIEELKEIQGKIMRVFCKEDCTVYEANSDYYSVNGTDS